jgi:hypothetical protein
MNEVKEKAAQGERHKVIPSRPTLDQIFPDTKSLDILKAEQRKARIFVNGVDVKGQKRTFPNMDYYIGLKVDLFIMKEKTLVFYKGKFIGLITGTNPGQKEETDVLIPHGSLAI